MNKRMVAAVAGIALLLNGCGAGGGAGGFSKDGVGLGSLDSNLGDIEKAWRSELDHGKLKVRYGNDARCYATSLRTGRDKSQVLGNEALCGPYRSVGAAATQWATVPVTLESGDGGASGKLTSTGKVLSTTVPDKALFVRGDGKKPNLAAVVDEPDAPPAAVGEVIDVTSSVWSDRSSGSSATPAPGAYQLKDTDPLKYVYTSSSSYGGSSSSTYAGTVKVARGSANRAGEAEQRKSSPAGGTFVVFSWSFDSTSSSTRDVTWAVSAGGKSYPVNVGGNNHGAGAVAVAVPGDGSDAVVQMLNQGATQEIGADGKRNPKQAAGLYVDLKNSQGSFDEYSQGSETKGSVQFKSSTGSPSISVGGYSSDLKWPGDGKVWLEVSVSYSTDKFRYFYGSGSYQYDSYSIETMLDGGDFTCGDTPAKKVTVQSTYSFKVLCEAPAKAGDVKLTGTLKLHGKASSYRNDATPATQDIAAKINGTINLR